MQQTLLIKICQFSAICLLTSSPLKRCQVGWGQMHIFRFLQKYLTGFNHRLWLGHSKTSTELSISHSCCVLRVTVLLEVKPAARLRFWMLWTGFSLRLSLYIFFALRFSPTLMSPSVPAAEKQPHSMRLLPAHYTFGVIRCRWWVELVSFKHDAWNWGSSDQIILFLTVWGYFRCFFAHFQVSPPFLCPSHSCASCQPLVTAATTTKGRSTKHSQEVHKVYNMPGICCAVTVVRKNVLDPEEIR